MHKIISCLAVFMACLLTAVPVLGGPFGPSARETQLEEDLRLAKSQIVALQQKVIYLNKDVERLNKELADAGKRPLHGTVLGLGAALALAALFLGIFLGTRTVKNWRSVRRKEYPHE
jgi:hypothetical protein